MSEVAMGARQKAERKCVIEHEDPEDEYINEIESMRREMLRMVKELEERECVTKVSSYRTKRHIFILKHSLFLGQIADAVSEMDEKLFETTVMKTEQHDSRAYFAAVQDYFKFCNNSLRTLKTSLHQLECLRDEVQQLREDAVNECVVKEMRDRILRVDRISVLFSCIHGWKEEICAAESASWKLLKDKHKNKKLLETNPDMLIEMHDMLVPASLRFDKSQSTDGERVPPTHHDVPGCYSDGKPVFPASLTTSARKSHKTTKEVAFSERIKQHRKANVHNRTTSHKDTEIRRVTNTTDQHEETKQKNTKQSNKDTKLNVDKETGGNKTNISPENGLHKEEQKKDDTPLQNGEVKGGEAGSSKLHHNSRHILECLACKIVFTKKKNFKKHMTCVHDCVV